MGTHKLQVSGWEGSGGGVNASHSATLSRTQRDEPTGLKEGEDLVKCARSKQVVDFAALNMYPLREDRQRESEEQDKTEAWRACLKEQNQSITVQKAAFHQPVAH